MEAAGTTWLWLGLGLTLLALAAGLWAWYLDGRSGLPAGKVIYSDMGAWYPQREPLYAPDLQLVGRPDYLIRQGDGSIVPVEVKSGQTPARPYQSHVLQLAAYCLLVEENFDQRPAYGILQYREKAFAVEYTAALEEELLDLLAEMRAELYQEEVGRHHNDGRRCARCGLRPYCDQRLA